MQFSQEETDELCGISDLAHDACIAATESCERLAAMDLGEGTFAAEVRLALAQLTCCVSGIGAALSHIIAKIRSEGELQD